MEYFFFIRKIKIFSVLSVIFPVLALSTCLLLYAFFGKIGLHDNLINYDEENLYIDWDQSYVWDINLSEFLSLRSPSIGIGKKKTITNCSHIRLDRFALLKDGTEIQHISKNEKILKENVVSNNLEAIFFRRTSQINHSCIKNYPLLNNIIINVPILEKILIQGKLENTVGFSEIKNPLIYGEVSISRTARYFPANFIFKPLIILSSIFLIFYWINNFNILKSINLNFKKGLNKFLFFGLLSAILLILHAIFLGVVFDNVFFKIFRRSIIILFVISEITAQILLTRSLYLRQNYLSEFINLLILKLKIIFVSLIFIVTLIAFTILVWGEPTTVFKHVLEWNYFLVLLIYYILSYLMWSTNKTQVHTP